MHSSSRSRFARSFALLSLVSAVACGTAPAEDRGETTGQALRALGDDEIVGSIHYGETSATIPYSENPRFRALSFDGQEGDAVDVEVHSPASAMAWLLAADFSTITHDYVAPPNATAHLSATLPSTGKYYIAFREANLEDTTFTVKLSGTPKQRGIVIGKGAGTGPFFADDGFVVAVNGNQVVSDMGSGSPTRDALKVMARPGDWVTMSFFDTFGQYRGHDEIWISGAGIAPQKVLASFDEIGNAYPADKKQPFDVVVFQVPAAGQQAALGCLPDIPLNTDYWQKSSNLTVNTATSKVYNVTWSVNQRTWNFTPDCNGWVSDVFIGPNGSQGAWATVYWNVITHRMRTVAVDGHPYDANIARSAADWATKTIFPAGDLQLLSIE